MPISKHYLWLALGATMLSSGLRAQVPGPEAEVKALLQQFFDGMRAADSAAVKGLFLPEARLQSAALNAQGQLNVQNADIDQFCSRLQSMPAGSLDERLGHTVILVDGPLATAWTAYTFYLNGQLSHCGVNAFQLVRHTAGWRILQITDTRRRQNCEPLPSEPTASLNAMIDNWHQAAAKADEDAFFGAMTPDGIYLGTDASERWLRDELRTWAAFAFERESAWNFTPSGRQLYFSHDGNYAWWEENLDTWMGVCRGSGVARLTADGWKIAHYHLSVTIPNDKIKAFIELVKAP